MKDRLEWLESVPFIRQVIRQVSAWPAALKDSVLNVLLVCSNCNTKLDDWYHFEPITNGTWQLWRWKHVDGVSIHNELVSIQPHQTLHIVMTAIKQATQLVPGLDYEALLSAPHHCLALRVPGEGLDFGNSAFWVGLFCHKSRF